MRTIVHSLLFCTALVGYVPQLRPASQIDFVRIAPGEFMMGCSTGDNACEGDERPAHRVRISKLFEMSSHEVTQAQWIGIMGSNPSAFKGPDQPVEQVSWNDVQEFLRRLNAKKDGYRYRLPTEAEWEYAARAGTTGPYAGSLEQMAWFSKNAGDHTHPVGQKQPNSWGLYDMHGNVWEWVMDWYSPNYYQTSSPTDPQGPQTGQQRSARGGSIWGNERFTRISGRGAYDPGDTVDNIGFRCVREAVTNPGL